MIIILATVYVDVSFAVALYIVDNTILPSHKTKRLVLRVAS